MTRSLPIRARCQDCEWEESAPGDELHTVNERIVDHHVETGHEIVSP